MRIQVGIHPSTSADIIVGTKSFTIKGLNGLINYTSLKRVAILRNNVSRVFVIAPPVLNFSFTLLNGIYTIDLTGLIDFNFQSSDKIEAEIELADKQDAIETKIDLIKIGVDSLSDNRIKYTYNITTIFGNIVTFFPTANGIVSSIEGITIQQIFKNGVLQSLPFIVIPGDIIKVKYTENPPRTISFVVYLVSQQFSAIQNSNYSSFLELYGAVFGVVSSTLNKTLLFARQGGTVISNSDLSVEKVISPTDLIGVYNFSSALSNAYPVWEKFNILEINKYLFFTGLVRTALYRYDPVLKTLTTITIKSIRNFIKVQTSGGIVNIYVATTTGLWKYNPETGFETLIDSTAISCVFWHPSLNKIYSFVAGFCRVYNADNDNLLTTITLPNASNFAFVQFSQLSNRILALNPLQIGFNLITIINTTTDIVEANRSIGNIMIGSSGLMVSNNHFYFGNSTNSSIGYLNITTLPASVSSIFVPAGPHYIFEHGNYIYVSCYTSNKVVIIDNSNQVVSTLEVEPGPGVIFYDSIRNLIIVLCQLGNSVHQIIPY